MSDLEITGLWSHWDEQDREAMSALLATVYDQLRRLTRRDLRNEGGSDTLGARGLVRQAWLKLIDEREHNWKDRAHFYVAAARAMRRLLVDYARKVASSPVDDLLAIDAALQDLSAVSDRLVRVVECRYFGGLTIPETAEALGVSHTTVLDDWQSAREWLRRRYALV